MCIGSILAVHAQTRNEQNTPSHPQRKPDIENVRYGPHEMNDLDLYLAKSDKPTPLVLFYFPGAFVAGNKYTVPPLLIDACKKAASLSPRSIIATRHRSRTPRRFSTPPAGSSSYDCTPRSTT